MKTQADGEVLIEGELAPGGVIVYYADGDEEIIYVNQYVIDLFECDSFDDFMQFTGGTFTGFVQSNDIDSAESSIWGQVAGRDGYDHIFYQITTKTGRTVNIDDYGRLITSEDKRPLFYVFVAEIDQGSSIDWLTGLATLERFTYVASLELAAREDANERMAVVSFDIMGMRAYNAVYGRASGDTLLRGFADVLRNQFGTESCCRSEGDSFFALVSYEDTAKRVHDVFSEFESSGVESVPPVAAGATIIVDETDVASAIDRANVALNADTHTWESHLTWFTDRMRSDELLRVHILDHLELAMRESWIRPYYQGIVRSASGSLCGMEALARWEDPTYGVILPELFISVLEEAGQLAKFDMYMVERVIDDLTRHISLGAPVVPVSINVSLSEIDDTDVAHEVIRRMDNAHLAHDLLRVEFTESAATKHPLLLRDQIESLHAAEVEVWMDDFGSGYSSLSLIGEFDFDLIKLDESFLTKGRLSRSEVIVDGVIRAAKRMGVRILAEGVEKREDAESLASMGCDMMQGFFFSKPRPADAASSDMMSGAIKLLEPREEAAYWNAVSSVSLADLASNGEGKGVSETDASTFPVGVLEQRDGAWRMLRLNDTLEELLVSEDVYPSGLSPLEKGGVSVVFDDVFESAVRRCDESRTWERISGRIERGSGFQFYVCPLASCKHARAYVVTSTPTMLGSALGTYGDVPVAYAVLRVIKNEDGDGAADVEFVFANDLYHTWVGLDLADLTGKSLLEVTGAAGLRWLPLCYAAAFEGKGVHDIYYSQDAGHWLSYNIMQSPIPEHCVFAFTLVDAEQDERAQIIAARDTSESIIDITDALNDELGYEAAMQSLLEQISKVIHPDRLYIFERGPETTTNTFEWCAPGVEPMIETLRDVDNEEFATWDELLARDSVVIIPDVRALLHVDQRMYNQLSRQGISRMLAVPFYESGELLGYLGADNYALEERLDTRKVLETVSSFVSSRIANRRLMSELELMGTHDALTGLLNRRGIDDELERHLGEEGLDKPFVMVLIDVDDFKTINDLYGHDVGDEALRMIAREITRVFPDDAIIGRNGGDEMLVVLFGEEAMQVDSILSGLTHSELQFSRDERNYQVTLSCGYAWCPAGVTDLKQVYTKADEALYAVKLAGKSGYRGWTPELKETPQRSILGFTTRDLANGMPLAMVAHKPDGELLFANEGLARLLEFGTLREALANIGESVWTFVHPEDAHALRELMQNATNSCVTGDEVSAQVRLITKTDRSIRVSYRARLIESEEADPVMYAYMVERE